ncbi:nephrin [Ixodes scapularis]
MSLDVGLRSVASYIPRSRADYGSLLCWGKNSVGLQLKPCVFSIQAAGPPEPLSNCNVLNATADSLQIACDSGYDGGLEQTFHLEVIDSLRSETLATKEQRDRAVFFVHPLPPGTEFIVRAFAQNAKGRSDSDIFTTSTEELSTGNNGDSLALSMSPLLGVLIGAIAALVLVAVIIAIIMRMRVHDTDTDSGEPDTTEKSQTLLRKGVEDRAEGDIKDPDIIPPKGDLEGDSLALSMSPLLGVLIGAIAALVLVAVIIAIIMRMRVHDTDTDSGEPDTTEKSQTLLRKGVEDRAEGDIKDPDIIPPKGDLEDPEWVFRQLNGSNGRISRDVGVTKGAMMYGTLPNVKIQRHPQFSDDMMYRERYLLGQEYGGVVERHRATGFRPQGSLPDPDEVDRMISSNTPLVSGTQLRPQRRDTPERERRTISTPV